MTKSETRIRPFAWACLAVATTTLVVAPSVNGTLWWTTAALLSCGALVFHLAKHSRLGIFAPAVICAGFGVLYALPFALTFVGGGLLLDERAYALGAVSKAAWLHTLGILTILAGYLLYGQFGRPSRNRPSVLSREWPSSFLLPVALLVMALGAFTTLQFFAAYGGSVGLQGESYAGRGLAMRGEGLRLSGMHFVSVIALVAYYDAAARHRRSLAIVFLAGAGALLLFWTIVTGSRGPLLRFMIAAVAVHAFTGGRVTRRTALIAGSAVLLATLVHSVIGRNFAVLRSIDWRTVPYFALNPANGEFGSVIPTTADVIANVPSNEPHEFGTTYVEAVGVVVPRFIWPNRPLAAGEWYAAEFYPSVWQSGGAYGFSPIAEAFLNFGVAGVFLLGLFFGMLLHRWEDTVAASTGNDPRFGVISYALATPWLAFMWRLDFASVLKNYAVLTMIPVAAVILAAAILRASAALHARALKAEAVS